MYCALMDRVDRVVRASVFRLLVGGSQGPTPGNLAEETGLDVDEVARSLQRLADEHLLALSTADDLVMMAHPFSGVPTDYQGRIGDRTWWANCGWDAFAILALLGDGEVIAKSVDGSISCGSWTRATANWTRCWLPDDSS